MTSLFIYLLRKQSWFSIFSNLADQGQQPPHRERNRLKKEPPPEAFRSCDELLDIIRSQSHLTVRFDQSDETIVYRDQPESQPRPISQPSMKSQQLNDSISLYNQYELKLEEFKRTRAKTPVFRIGQLERQTCADRLSGDIDDAIVLAQQYQAVLPSRSLTPCHEVAASNTRRNGLRRVKCRDSLRDLARTNSDETQSSESGLPNTNWDDYSCDVSIEKIDALAHSFAENYRSTSRPARAQILRRSFYTPFIRRHSSDSDTLLGSDSEPSPNSSAPHTFSDSDLEAFKVMHEADQTMTETDEIGMQLCMDLLTNDLASALQRQHPLEPGNRVSGLQLLLMIEAYESLQQKLRRMGPDEDHVSAADEALEHWLQALRSIYERSTSNIRQRRGPST